jgi:ribosomal protein S18 acetylase RimI-like enzyme
MNMSGTNLIRRMAQQDIVQVASLHIQAFPGFFLSSLGDGFLKELYTSILADPSGIAYVYENCKLEGFVAGTTHPVGFYRRLLSSRLLYFCLPSMLPMVRQPQIIPRLFRALNSPREADAGEGCGTLMSIAVSPDAQGKGIGKQLVEVYLAEAAYRGNAEVNLTTDRLNNESVNRFYVRYGFRLMRQFATPEGRVMNEYRISTAWSQRNG